MNKLTPLEISVPRFDVPSLSALENVSVPTGFEDDLRRLNASIPSLDELRESVQRLIEVPFGKMKAELNETFTLLIGNVTVSSLPTIDPARRHDGATALQICDGMDVSFIDDAASSLAKIARIGTGLILAGFFLLWIALIAWEWYTYKVIKEQAGYIEERIEREGGVGNGMMVVHVVEHPVLEKFAEMAFDRFRIASRTRANLRWFGESGETSIRVTPTRSSQSPTSSTRQPLRSSVSACSRFS